MSSTSPRPSTPSSLSISTRSARGLHHELVEHLHEAHHHHEVEHQPEALHHELVEHLGPLSFHQQLGRRPGCPEGRGRRRLATAESWAPEGLLWRPYGGRLPAERRPRPGPGPRNCPEGGERPSGPAPHRGVLAHPRAWRRLGAVLGLVGQEVTVAQPQSGRLGPHRLAAPLPPAWRWPVEGPDVLR